LIHANVGYSVLRLPGKGLPSVRPTEIQTLITPTQKGHLFILELEAGDYHIDLFGQIPTQQVAPAFGPEWIQGKPIPGWNGKYEFVIRPAP
jgi:hypothetical protein